MGAAALLAPEETQTVLDDAISTAGSIIGTVVGGIGSGLSKSPVAWIGIAAIAYWLFWGNDEDKDQDQQKLQWAKHRAELLEREADEREIEAEVRDRAERKAANDG